MSNTELPPNSDGEHVEQPAIHFAETNGDIDFPAIATENINEILKDGRALNADSIKNHKPFISLILRKKNNSKKVQFGVPLDLVDGDALVNDETKTVNLLLTDEAKNWEGYEDIEENIIHTKTGKIVLSMGAVAALGASIYFGYQHYQQKKKS